MTVLVYNLTRVFMELGMFDASWIGELDPSSALLTVCTDVVEKGRTRAESLYYKDRASIGPTTYNKIPPTQLKYKY